MRTPHLQSGGRYPVLRAIGIIYVVMAGLSVIVGLIAAGYILAAQPWSMTTRVVWAIVSLAGTCFAVIGSLAIAEVLKLFMDIEYSCRKMALGGSTISPGTTSWTVSSSTDGGIGGRFCEETAESALIKGH